MVRPGSVAMAAGLGLAAGLAGTAAMSVSTAIETRLGAEPASAAAPRAAGKTLGVRPGSTWFAGLVHLGYGSGWGLARAALGQLGLSAPAATAVHLAALWTSEQITLPALGVTAPVTRQRPSDAAADAWNCLAYAAVTSAAYELLDRAR
jgi:hypothetical protein